MRKCISNACIQVFTSFFTLEAVLKLLALSKEYFGSGWNIFDLIIVIASLIDLSVESVNGISVLRGMRLVSLSFIQFILYIKNKQRSYLQVILYVHKFSMYRYLYIELGIDLLNQALEYVDIYNKAKTKHEYIQFTYFVRHACVFSDIMKGSKK